MSAYPPVTRIPAIFNPTIYGVDGTEDYLTLGQADNRYLKLTGGVVSGQLTINNDLSADDLFVNDGSVSNPSISFRDDTDTGLYSSTNGVIDFTNNNNNSLTLTQTELVSRNRVLLQDGSLGNPSLAFFNQQDVGLYRSQNNRLDFAVNGNTPLSLRSNDTYILGDIHIPSGASNGYVLTSNGSGKGTWQAVSVPSSVSLVDGSVSSPSINFIDDPDTGIYSSGDNQVSVAAEGQLALSVNKNGTYFVKGTLSAPSISFLADSDTGFFQFTSGNNEIWVACGGQYASLISQSGFYVRNSLTTNWAHELLSDGRLIIKDVSVNTKITLHPTDGLIHYGDNTGENVRMRHDGTNGYITWNTGDLLVLANTTEIARFTSTNAQIKKPLILGTGVNNTTLLTFSTERSWFVTSGFSGSGSSTSLDWCSTGGGKDLNILINDTSLASNLRYKFGTSSGTFTTYNTSGNAQCVLAPSGIYSVNGSAASPSLSWLNANTTGLYYATSPTATIGMAMNGANIMEYTTNGFYFNYSGATRMKFEFGSGIWHYGDTSGKYIFMQHDSYNAVIRWNYGNIYVQRPGSTAGVVLTPTGTAWASASDRKLKKNIQEVEPVLEKLKHIKSYKYSLKCEECPDNKPSKYGFMADEVEPYFPEVIETIDITENTKALKYTEMVPILCKGIVELDEKCIELRTENETLKSKVLTLETTLQSVLERLTILEQQQQQSTNI